jgi:hypothetical protein
MKLLLLFFCNLLLAASGMQVTPLKAAAAVGAAGAAAVGVVCLGTTSIIISFTRCIITQPVSW